MSKLLLTIILFLNLHPVLLPSQKNLEAVINSETTPVNIIVLLDLSDRIDSQKHPHQAARDLLVLEDIVAAFDQMQRKQFYLRSQDVLNIAIARQSKTSFNSLDFHDGLTIDMQGKTSKPAFDVKRSTLDNSLKKLYQQATSDPSSGADIWSWFRDELPDLMKENAHNKVIILTDGYITFHKEVSRQRAKGSCMLEPDLLTLRNSTNVAATMAEKSIGLLAHPVQLQSLSAMLLEVTPEKPEIHSNELEILSAYWKNWFQKMGVKADLHQQFGSRTTCQRHLSNFLSR